MCCLSSLNHVHGHVVANLKRIRLYTVKVKAMVSKWLNMLHCGVVYANSLWNAEGDLRDGSVLVGIITIEIRVMYLKSTRNSVVYEQNISHSNAEFR